MGAGASDQNSQGLEKTLREQKKNEKASKEFPPFTQNEIERMKQKFNLLDSNKKGSITLEDFKYFPEIQTHFFKYRIYYLVEKKLLSEGKTEIDFQDFVSLMQVFHPQAGLDSKYVYLFEIYDVDEDELINEQDIVKCQKIFYQEPYKTPKGQQFFMGALMGNQQYLDKMAHEIMKEYDTDKSGAIDLEEFKVLVDELDMLFRMNINF